MHKRLCNCEGKGILELEPYIPAPFNGTFLCFADYYRLHYKPLLDQLAKESTDPQRTNVLNNMLGDLNAVFLGYAEEYDKD